MKSESVLSLDPAPSPMGDPSPAKLSAGGGLTDAVLAERLRREPRQTLPLVYERFATQVNHWVWRLLGADPEHNDIVQQVFIRILHAAPRLRDEDKLGAWVHAITVNTVHGELRRRQVRRFFLRDQPAEPLHGDFVREVEMRDLLVRAKSVIEKLPPGERIAFMLHHVDHLTAAEVAELCGYSLSTAKRRIARGTRRFEAIVAASPELYRLLPRLTVEGP